MHVGASVVPVGTCFNNIASGYISFFLKMVSVTVIFPFFWKILFLKGFLFWAKFRGAFFQKVLWKTRSDARSN